MGIQIGEGLYLSNLLFADDQVLIAQDEEDINYTSMLRKLKEEYAKWSLEINFIKTEYMTGNRFDETEYMTANSGLLEALRIKMVLSITGP
uniref:Reverse transcriptase domain-containing protein n=1 Tax=Rhodnius prolixus TaxID=13249 RepID=T1I4L4_RHOPR